MIRELMEYERMAISYRRLVMVTYQERVLQLLQEFSFLIFLIRRKGLLSVTQTAYLEDFDPVAKPIVRYGMQLLESGMAPEDLKMFLELKKIESLKNHAMTADDLKLIHISIQSLFFIQSGDLEGYGAFTWRIFDFEGNLKDRQPFLELLNFLQKIEKKKENISKQDLNKKIQKIKEESTEPRLSIEEIDKMILEKNTKNNINNS